MPLVEIKGFEACLTMEQKQALIQRVTDAVSSLGDEDLRLVTWVLVDGIPADGWDVGGQAHPETNSRGDKTGQLPSSGSQQALCQCFPCAGGVA